VTIGLSAIDGEGAGASPFDSWYVFRDQGDVLREDKAGPKALDRLAPPEFVARFADVKEVGPKPCWINGAGVYVDRRAKSPAAAGVVG
jgi:hypothetical protein